MVCFKMHRVSSRFLAAHRTSQDFVWEMYVNQALVMRIEAKTVEIWMKCHNLYKVDIGVATIVVDQIVSFVIEVRQFW